MQEIITKIEADLFRMIEIERQFWQQKIDNEIEKMVEGEPHSLEDLKCWQQRSWQTEKFYDLICDIFEDNLKEKLCGTH